MDEAEKRLARFVTTLGATTTRTSRRSPTRSRTRHCSLSRRRRTDRVLRLLRERRSRASNNVATTRRLHPALLSWRLLVLERDNDLVVVLHMGQYIRDMRTLPSSGPPAPSNSKNASRASVSITLYNGGRFSGSAPSLFATSEIIFVDILSFSIVLLCVSPTLHTRINDWRFGWLNYE